APPSTRGGFVTPGSTHDSNGAASSASAVVLLVDDDPQFRAALKRGLSGRGYRVTTAGSAEEALEVLRGTEIDVVVTDLRMGARSGIDLIRTVGAEYPRTKSILMSGDAQASETNEALSLGALQVLQKPFSPYDLATVVDAAVSERSS